MFKSLDTVQNVYKNYIFFHSRIWKTSSTYQMFNLRHFNTSLRILYVRTFCNWQLNIQCCKTSLNKDLIHLLRGKKQSKPTWLLRKKKKKSQNLLIILLIGCATLTCKNCSQAFAGNESLTSLLRKLASEA